MTDIERLARELLGIVTELLDVHPDPAQPSTASAIDAAVERLADALLDWSDQLRGAPARTVPRADGVCADAPLPRAVLRAELAAGRVPGDRHTVRSAAATLLRLRDRVEGAAVLATSLGTPTAARPGELIEAIGRLAAALDAHAEVMSGLVTLEDPAGRPSDTAIARRVRELDVAERELASVATTTLPQ